MGFAMGNGASDEPGVSPWDIPGQAPYGPGFGQGTGMPENLSASASGGHLPSFGPSGPGR